MSLIRASRNSHERRVRKIRILRNGDCTFKGTTMHFKLGQYETIGSFLKDVATTLKKFVYIPTSGVSSLCSVAGKKVETLSDLREDVYYAMCAKELFKWNINVPATLHKQRPATSYVRSVSPYLDQSEEGMELPDVRSDVVQPKFIIVIQNGVRPRHIRRYLLNKRNSTTFKQVLAEINREPKTGAGTLNVIYNQEGTEVTELDDFFGYHYIFFAYEKRAHTSFADLKLDAAEDETVENLITHSTNAKQTTVRPFTASRVGPQMPPQLRMKYTIVKTIAEGGFSKVMECQKQNGEKYAMKIIDKSQYTSTSDHLLRNELAIMRLRFPHLSRLITVHDDSAHLYLLMDLFPGGDLYDAVAEHRIPEHEAYLMAGDVATALFYLHSVNYVHRDLKPSNLLVNHINGRRTLKLIDFGVAAKALTALYLVCGTTAYMAPEMLRQSGHGVKVDVWAAGVTLYFMLVQAHPFDAETDEEYKTLILEGGIEMEGEEWREISEEAKDLLNHMLDYDKRRRFSAADILRHPWIRGKFGDTQSASEPISESSGSDGDDEEEEEGGESPTREAMYHTADEEDLSGREVRCGSDVAATLSDSDGSHEDGNRATRNLSHGSAVNQDDDVVGNAPLSAREMSCSSYTDEEELATRSNSGVTESDETASRNTGREEFSSSDEESSRGVDTETDTDTNSEAEVDGGNMCSDFSVDGCSSGIVDEEDGESQDTYSDDDEVVDSNYANMKEGDGGRAVTTESTCEDLSARSNKSDISHVVFEMNHNRDDVDSYENEEDDEKGEEESERHGDVCDEGSCDSDGARGDCETEYGVNSGHNDKDNRKVVPLVDDATYSRPSNHAVTEYGDQRKNIYVTHMCSKLADVKDGTWIVEAEYEMMTSKEDGVHDSLREHSKLVAEQIHDDIELDGVDKYNRAVDAVVNACEYLPKSISGVHRNILEVNEDIMLQDDDDGFQTDEDETQLNDVDIEDTAQRVVGNEVVTKKEILSSTENANVSKAVGEEDVTRKVSGNGDMQKELMDNKDVAEDTSDEDNDEEDDDDEVYFEAQ